MTRLFRGAIAALLLTSVSGCMSLITGGELLRPGEPTGVIVVENASNVPIDVVLISDCNVGSYGLNRLPQGTEIAPGRSYTFTVSAGCWDVDAGTTYGGMEARQRMQVRAGSGVRYTVS